MGANHATRTLHTSPVATPATARNSTSQRNETDAAPTATSLIPPSRLRGRGVVGGQKYLLSLDRNMKVFLRASNLPGLEYRLKLAGYRTFHDLLNTDRETLESKGFTGIMAQRLMTAVLEYINRQIYRSEEKQLPFRLVRKGQRLQTEPSESMRDNPNYRKRNVKRQKSSGEEMTNKGPHITHGNSPPTALQPPSHVRLMSESDLQVQHLLSPPLQEPTETLTPSPQDSGSDENSINGHGEQLPPEDSSGQRIVGVIVKQDGSLVLEEPPSIGEPPFQDLSTLLTEEEGSLEGFPHTGSEQLEETDFSSDPTFGLRFSRSFSVPADFELMNDKNPSALSSKNHVVTHVRTFSSPASMVSPATNTNHLHTTTSSTAVPSSIGKTPEQHTGDGLGGRGMAVSGQKREGLEEGTAVDTNIDVLIETLRHAGRIGDLYHTLRSLLSITKQSRDAVGAASEKGALVAVVDVMRKHCGVVMVANVCCKLMQQLCQDSSNGSVPQDALSVVCKALEMHLTFKPFSLRALLTTASLCATDELQCHAILCEGLLESVATAMDTHHDDTAIQAAAIATLATALAHVPEGRLPLLFEHGHVLDLVLQAMTRYSADGRLQHYSLSFLALLVSAVAKDINSGVMQLIVECTAVTMETMSCDSHVTYWGCNVFAHATDNAALKEWKLATRCCDPAVEALRKFPRDSAVYGWAVYALCRLATAQRVCNHLVASDLLSLLSDQSSNPLPLPSKTEKCLRHLHHLLLHKPNHH